MLSKTMAVMYAKKYLKLKIQELDNLLNSNNLTNTEKEVLKIQLKSYQNEYSEINTSRKMAKWLLQ